MRRGEVAPKGTWTGGSLPGGVKAPDALILPDPATRFARTAARLDFLSAGHPMAEWLRFMARLAAAQHAVASAAAPFGPDQAAVEQAGDARLPPLAVNGDRRDPARRGGLGLLVEGGHGGAVRGPARAGLGGLLDAGVRRG